MMRRIYTLVVSFFLAFGVPVLAAQQYDVLDLGSLGGGGTRGLAINALGQVTGETSILAGNTRAFITPAAGAIKVPASDLGTLGGQATYGRGINAAGQVVGNSYVAN